VLKRSIENVARARLALPVVIALALVAMAVNESTYQHTIGTLDRGIALTDARIEAARTLQSLTELEAAARAHAASGGAGDRQRFEQAASELAQAKDKALALVESVDPHGAEGARALRTLIDAQASRLRQQLGPAPAAAPPGDAPSPGGAAEIDRSRQRVAELGRQFDDVLGRAAALQQQARTSLYDAFMLNRLAMHALVLLVVLALVLFGRQLRRTDEQRDQQHQRLESLIGQRTAQLRALAGHLVTAREDERARLARELHDEMGGLLTAMKLELARLRRVAPLPEGALPRLSGLEGRLNEGIALKRRIVENLRPSSLDQLGLKVALELLCADTAAVAGLPVQCAVDEVALDKDSELTLFRIVQEALNNICKHAAAHNVSVRLQAEAEIATLRIEDDGRGFEPAEVGTSRHGLVGMRVRLEAHGGALAVDSAPGSGTRITASLPLATKPPVAAATL
jgi:signal transduction histidine kinase